jgi:hypothetical protein
MLLSARAIWISDCSESTLNLAVIGCCLLRLMFDPPLSLDEIELDDDPRRKIEAARFVRLGETLNGHP